MAHLRLPDCCKDVPSKYRYWVGKERLFLFQGRGWSVPECHGEGWGKDDLLLAIHEDWKPKAKLKAVK